MPNKNLNTLNAILATFFEPSAFLSLLEQKVRNLDDSSKYRTQVTIVNAEITTNKKLSDIIINARETIKTNTTVQISYLEDMSIISFFIYITCKFITI